VYLILHRAMGVVTRSVMILLVCRRCPFSGAAAGPRRSALVRCESWPGVRGFGVKEQVTCGSWEYGVGVRESLSGLVL